MHISLVLNQKLNVSFGNASKYFYFNDWSLLAFLFVKVSSRISFLLFPSSFLLPSGESRLLKPTTAKSAADCGHKRNFNETGTQELPVCAML